ncbi:MAG: DUF2292 domain-containing protein [Geobacter sp.]|nr:DUF2292 domain-containing protein [Geobacter sp.]
MAVPSSEQWNRELERHIREALKEIRYGSVTLVVQDGLVIQIDKSEKVRLVRQGHIHGSGI